MEKKKQTITFDDNVRIVPLEEHKGEVPHCGLSTGKHLWEDIPPEEVKKAVQAMIDAGLATTE